MDVAKEDMKLVVREQDAESKTDDLMWQPLKGKAEEEKGEDFRV